MRACVSTMNRQAVHVRDPTKDALAKQEERKKKKKPVVKGKNSTKASERGQGSTKASKKATTSHAAGPPTSTGSADEAMHPSWAAKKQANAATIQPFQGKKITFD
eukprot:m.70660 g.70660  ORF g.70660 m.70660 type:complete len:105 (-) comp8659_c0_seq2:64-378(-)